MRLDKFLKVARIIKRRTVAKNVADNKKIKINDNIGKASTKIKVGDVIELIYYSNRIKFKINELPAGNIKKDEVDRLITIIEQENIK